MLTVRLHQVADFDDLEEDKFLNAVVKVGFKNTCPWLLMMLTFPVAMFHQDIFMCVLSTALSYSYCNCLFSIVCQAQCSNLLKDLVLSSKTLLCFVINHVLIT